MPVSVCEKEKTSHLSHTFDFLLKPISAKKNKKQKKTLTETKTRHTHSILFEMNLILFI